MRLLVKTNGTPATRHKVGNSAMFAFLVFAHAEASVCVSHWPVRMLLTGISINFLQLQLSPTVDKLPCPRLFSILNGAQKSEKHFEAKIVLFHKEMSSPPPNVAEKLLSGFGVR